MNERLKSTQEQEKLREKIVGLGEHSFRRSYYPELQKRLADLEQFHSLLDHSNDMIFMLDQDGRFTYVNRSVCDLLHYCSDELSRMTVYDIMPFIGRDVLASLLSGQKASARFETEFRGRGGQTIPFEVSLRIVSSDHSRRVIAVSRDITEHKQDRERLQQSYVKLESMTMSIINAISKVVEMRDPYTAGHQRHVSQLAHAIAREMEVSEERAEWIRIAGLIHDIGKLNVPAEILSKPGKLTPLEFEIIKIHPSAGYEIVKLIDFPQQVAEVAHQHQERLDGSGYPRGLKGEEICIEARIVSVADVIEAMAFPRPYREVIGLEKALRDIARGKGILYYAPAVDSCLRLFREHRFIFDAPVKKGEEKKLVMA
jgi:PAS domain S-box-containing protein/putative nucleotidyltransferase with HDIG domain